MTFFNNLFVCNNKNEMQDLKDRVTKLELQVDGIKDLLLEIKMNIKLIHMEMKIKA